MIRNEIFFLMPTQDFKIQADFNYIFLTSFTISSQTVWKIIINVFVQNNSWLVITLKHRSPNSSILILCYSELFSSFYKKRECIKKFSLSFFRWFYTHNVWKEPKHKKLALIFQPVNQAEFQMKQWQWIYDRISDTRKSSLLAPYQFPHTLGLKTL